MKKVLNTPISSEDIKDIRIGDIIYISGTIVTCRDVAHRRLIEEGIALPVDLHGLAIFHAGPIVKDHGNDEYEMSTIGPPTSMRMEKFEKEFIEQTGVKLIVGKGGMGKNTEEGCKEHKALHLVYPAGNAVYAARKVDRIKEVHWTDLGMPESLWVSEVTEFGPLIVSIDTEGNNIFENNKVEFNRKKDEVYESIAKEVRFIK